MTVPHQRYRMIWERHNGYAPDICARAARLEVEVERLLRHIHAAEHRAVVPFEECRMCARLDHCVECGAHGEIDRDARLCPRCLWGPLPE